MTFTDYDSDDDLVVTAASRDKDDVRKRSLNDNDSVDTVGEEFGFPKTPSSASKTTTTTTATSKQRSNTSLTGDILVDYYVTARRYLEQLSPKAKSIIGFVILLVASTYTLHGMDGPSASGKGPSAGARIPKTGAASSRNPFLPPIKLEPIPSGETCSDICVKRNTKRQEKYGGDLLNPQDVLRLAKDAREKSIANLKVDYGSYFEEIFMNVSSPYKYYGMRGANGDGPSRDRLKRKLKLKVLHMMQTLRGMEEDVAGCNCLGAATTGEPQGETAPVPPQFYEKYVFANGGHSQAAGHGNMFNETYTAYFTKDVKDVFGAIGIKFEGRNYGMGAMSASPYISICSKEIFGIDVDLLSWNFGMTDKWHDTSSFYMYRGALTPGRPALLYIEGNGQANHGGRGLEEEGLAVFKADMHSVPTVTRSANNKIPDSAPGGIRLSDEELEKLPPYLQALKCNGNLAGKPFCNGRKWSCTMEDIENGKQCACPKVGKRSSWHMGYRMHALLGHLISLSFMEIFIEALEEITTSSKESNTQALYEELRQAEDQEFEAFKAKPVFDKIAFNQSRYSEIYNNTELFETFFKGDSVCRTSLVPSQTRYLGISTNSDKVAPGPQPGWAETYDVGVPLHISAGKYTYDEGQEPIPGIVQQTAKIDLRVRSDEFRKYCSQIVMPDYKDWLYGPLKDGKTTMIFPNEKEKEYYGYDPSKFKGYLGLVPTLFGETAGKGVSSDISFNAFETNVRATVNGKKVGKFHMVNQMILLVDESGSYKWEPSENNDYVIEFEPYGEIDGIPAADKHFRLYGAVVY
ncbi:unnamed protein product [Cylindrotheca closterium]|uniref:Uncharacterized protein n=1 Tax=Cylindrotheca closterium TaxID=2856 RepID=A0AAD2G437_9STRA|nr:unnamed protein product [Cylindrotheca closterium]